MRDKNEIHIDTILFIMRVFKLIMCVLLLIAVVFMLLHPMTASAAEKAPGGANNTVVIDSVSFNSRNNYKTIDRRTLIAKDDCEIIGYLVDYINSSTEQVSRSNLKFYMCGKDGFTTMKEHLEDFTGYKAVYQNEELTQSYAHDINTIISDVEYWYAPDQVITVTCNVTGMKIFKDVDAATAYVESGSLDGMLKDEYDFDWYLKDLDYKVDADDSPTSEAGEDATYITFKWSIDNLEDGDLLEIKTHNYLKKIGGDQISGFHDYITWSNNVSAYSGKYRFSQYDATKAWFNTLENKPLFFKSYDTDIYYLRPYRNGVYGRWVKVTIGRSPAIKGSPYVEDVEYGDFDEDGEWIEDKELTDKNGGHHGIDQNGNLFYPDKDNPFEGTNVAGIFSWFFNFMKDIPSLLGELPALVSSIVSFLPSYVIGFIAIGIVVAIILRIAGR